MITCFAEGDENKTRFIYTWYMCIFHENQTHRMSKNSCSILSYLTTLNCIAFNRHFKEQAVTDDNKRIIAVKTWVFIFVLPALVGYPVE